MSEDVGYEEDQKLLEGAPEEVDDFLEDDED